MRDIGPGGTTIHPCSGAWATVGALAHFSFMWVCLLPDILYLSAQLVQVASSIIGNRYENVDSCARVQMHCYEGNLEESLGRPFSKVKKGEEKECQEKGLCFLPFHSINLYFIFKRNTFLRDFVT